MSGTRRHRLAWRSVRLGFLSLSLVLVVAQAAQAQARFRYGEDISGALDRVGPISFGATAETGALGRFVMEGPMPNRDRAYLDSATAAACAALGQQILRMARDIRRADYTHLIIMFSWVTSEIGPVKNFANYNGVFRAGSCTHLTNKKG